MFITSINSRYFSKHGVLDHPEHRAYAVMVIILKKDYHYVQTKKLL